MIGTLAQLWRQSAADLRSKHLSQLIAFAGEGRLLEDSSASKQFREFLRLVDLDDLKRYCDQCLGEKFEGNGYALQDLVNELGRRLDFSVVHGRYRGVVNAVGFDGLWASSDGRQLVVEVKTTDAYRIDLNQIASYRTKLSRSGEVSYETSSILIVVGRQDTGDLEAQIRGSRHAWDVRLISVQSLLRLLRIRQELDTPSTVRRIVDVLTPHEFTRVDGIIDLVFHTTDEVSGKRTGGDGDDEDDNQGEKPSPVGFHGRCIERIAKVKGWTLVQRSKAVFEGPDGLTVICVVSREHKNRGYWFGLLSHHKAALESAKQAYVAFGCGSPETILLVPAHELLTRLSNLHTTQREDGTSYWHVRILKEGDRLAIALNHPAGRLAAEPWLLQDSAPAT